MSSQSVPNNLQAFPGNIGQHGGMTLRDYFAAQAMQALIDKNPPLRVESGEDAAKGLQILREISKGAYEYADAMLLAREAK